MPVIHLKYGDTKLVRKGDYSSPIFCNHPQAKLMSSDLKEITCERCNKRIDSWGREYMCFSKPGIIKIRKYHLPQVPRWLP